MRLLVLLMALVSCCCGLRRDVPWVGVLQWTERIEAFRQTYRGLVDGLEEEGFVGGENLLLSYVNVDGDEEEALSTARDWVSRGVDLIIALGTGSALAAMKATSDVPIVYGIVGDPEATGVKGANVTGTSMKIPVGEQLRAILGFLPSLTKRVGVLYCPRMPQAVSTAKEALEAARALGLEVVEIVVPYGELDRLEQIMVAKLPGLGLLYIPTDPVLHRPEVFKRVYRVASRYYLPVVGVSQDVVRLGALMAYHPDFYEIGRQTAHQVALVLRGVPVKEVPPEAPVARQLSFNARTARELILNVDKTHLQRVDHVFQ